MKLTLQLQPQGQLPRPHPALRAPVDAHPAEAPQMPRALLLQMRWATPVLESISEAGTNSSVPVSQAELCCAP